MAKGLNQVNLVFTADTARAKQQVQELQKTLSNLGSGSSLNAELPLTKEIRQAIEMANELKGHLQAATNVNTGNLDFSKLNASLKASGKSLADYGVQLQKLGPQGYSAFMQLTSSVAQSELKIRSAQGVLKEFGTTLMNTARWQLSSSILHGFIGALQSSYRYAQDLNESLNNIRIVTGQNISQMEAFADRANKSAKALNTSTLKYTDASLIYYQQGLSDREVEERTNTTIKMANVSRQSAEEVSNQMTAIWNNFDDGSKSLEYYGDVITALGAKTASSSQEIATGLEKFAAVSKTVGLSYEYATAALATITATTRQSADTVGTGLRTLFSRLEGLKLGETLEDGVDLNKYSKALKAVGVDALDASGDLRQMDDILNDLGNRWQDLSQAQKVALAQTVGGVRQYTNLIALMDNWDFMQSNVEIAKNSEGTLNTQAEIFGESWEAASNRAKASIENFYSTIINDKAFINLTNTVAKVVDGITGLIKGLGGIPAILTSIGSLSMIVFKDKMAKGITQIGDRLKMLSPKYVNELREKRTAELTGLKDSIQDPVTGYVGAEEGAARRNMQQQAYLQAKFSQKAATMSDREIGETQRRLDSIRTFQDKSVVSGRLKDKALKTREDAQLGLKEQAKDIMGSSPQQISSLVKNLTTAAKVEALNLPVNIDQGNLEEVKTKLKALTTDNPDIQLGIDLDQADVSQVEAEIARIQEEGGYADYYFEGNGLGDEAEKVKNTAREEVHAQQTHNEDKKQVDEAVDSLDKDLDGKGKGTQNFATTLAGVASAATAVTGAIMGLKTAVDVLQDPNASGWDKFSAVMGALVPAVMAVVSVMNLMPAAGAAAAEGELLAMGPVGWIIAAFVALAAAVAIVVIAFVALANQEEKAIEKSNAALQKATENYDKAREASEQFKESLTGYEDAVEGLNKLVKGTEEYAAAVKEANRQAQSLIDQNENLNGKWHYNLETGLIEFDKGALKEASNYVDTREQLAREAYLLNKNENLQLKANYKVNQTVKKDDNHTRSLGSATVGAEIGLGATLLTIMNPFLSSMGPLVGALSSLLPALGAYKNEKEIAEKNAQQKSAIDVYAQAIAEHGNMTLAQAEQFGYLNESQVGLIQALGLTDAELSSLANEINANTAAIQEQNKEVIDNAFGNNVNYKNAKNKKELNSLLAKDYDTLYNQAYEDRYKNKKVSKADMKAYGQAQGLTFVEAKGDSVKYTDANGEEVSIAKEAINKHFASEEALNQLDSKIGTLDNVLTKLDKNESSIAAQALFNKISNGAYISGDTQLVDEETKNRTYTAEELQQEFGLDKEEFASLWSSMGYQSAEAFAQSYSEQLQNALVTVNDVISKLDFSKDTLEKGLEGTLSDQLENMSAKGAQNYAEAINGLIYDLGEDVGSEFVKTIDSVTKDLEPDQVKDFYKELGKITDFSDADQWDDFLKGLEEAGVVTEDNADAFTLYVNTAKDVANATKEIDFSKLFDQLSSLQDVIDKLEDGKIDFSDDDYQALVDAGVANTNFVKTFDGYRYLGTSAELLNEVNAAMEKSVLDAQANLMQLGEACLQAGEQTQQAAGAYTEAAQAAQESGGAVEQLSGRQRLAILLSRLFAAAIEKVGAVFTKIKGVIEKIADAIGNKITAVYDTIVNFIEGLINTLIDGLNLLVDALNEADFLGLFGDIEKIEKVHINRSNEIIAEAQAEQELDERVSDQTQKHEDFMSQTESSLATVQAGGAAAASEKDILASIDEVNAQIKAREDRLEQLETLIETAGSDKERAAYETEKQQVTDEIGALEKLGEAWQKALALKRSYADDKELEALGLSREKITDYAQELQKIPEFSQLGEEELLDLSFTIQKLSHDTELNTKDIAEYTSYLKTLPKFAHTSAQQTAEFAAGVLRLKRGLSSLSTDGKKWLKNLNEYPDASDEAKDAVKGLSKALSDITGLDASVFSRDWLLNPDNQKLIEDALTGEREAVQALQASLGEQKLSEALEGDLGDFKSTLDAFVAEKLPTLEIGTEINDTPFYNGLTEMVKQGKITAGELTDILSSMGMDVETETITLPSSEASTLTENGTYTYTPNPGEPPVTVPIGGSITNNGDGTSSFTIIKGAKYKGDGGGGKKGGGGGGGGKPKHLEKKQPTDAKDRYHVVKNQLEEQQSQYKRIDTAYQRAYGKSKLDLLDKQIAKQKELIKTQKQYLDEAKEYLKYDKQQLELEARKQVYNQETNEYTTVDTSVAGLGMSIEWNETGGIDNIDAIMKANLDRYNAEVDRINEALDSGKMTQEEADWAQKVAEAQYQGLLDTIKQYEETQDFVNEKLQDLIDAQNQYYDQLLEKTKLRVQLRVEVDEDSLNLINFLLERLEADAYKAAQRIDKLGDSFSASADKMDAYKWGLIDLLANHGDENAEGTFAKLMAGEITPEQLLQQMQEGGNTFTQAEADAIREYMQNIMSEATEQLEIQKKVIEEIGTVLEENNRRLDRQIGKIEHLQNVMSSYKNIIDLSGRQFLGITSEIYDAMEEANVKLANDTLEADKARMDASNAWLQKIKEDYAAVYDTLTDEAKKAYEEQIEAAEDAAQEATEAYYSSWEAAIEAINTRFESAMQHMAEDFSKTMAGVAGNLEGVQQRMDLRKMVADVYVPEYEKMYQLTKLTREAQKSIDNASNVKVKQELLRVQQKIVEAQESGAKISQYELDYLQRELDLKAAQMALEEASKAKSQVRMTRDSEGNYAYVYTANEEAVEEAEQNYADKLYEMQKLNEEYVASLQDMLVELESNYIQALQDAAETYGKGTEEYASAVADIQSQYGTYFDELMSEMGLVLSNNKETETIHAEIYKRLTGDVYQANVDLQTSWEETTLAGVTGYETLGQYQTAWAAASQKAYDDVIQANDIWMASMAEAYNLAGESIDTFAQTVGGDFEQIKEESQSLKKQIVEEDLPAMTEAINKVSESVKSWQKTYAEAIKAMLENTEKMIAKYNELLAAWSKVDRKHQAAEQQGNANDANSSSGTQTNGNDSNNNNGNNNSTKSSSGGGGGGSTGSTGNQGGYGGGGGSSGLIGGNNAIRNLTMLRFATGGYTGDWAGDEGKVAVLDRKELVLNAQDTFNILKAVDMIKTISQTIDINAMSAGGAFSNLISPFVSGTGDRLEQEVHITAEFPNVTNKNEILEAFDNVINLASQYANR